MSLSGRVCVVTGATRGIGRAVACQLGQHGAKVYITGRTMGPGSGPEIGSDKKSGQNVSMERGSTVGENLEQRSAPEENVRNDKGPEEGMEPRSGPEVSGSLVETAREVEARGGVCVPVRCDHHDDDEVAALFAQVDRENDGRLDILVNNAFDGNRAIFEHMGRRFWEMSVDMWDKVNTAGLRNNYLCAVYAARLMVPRRSGLIVNVSSAGGLMYMFNAAYGIGKTGCDRMAADCAAELRSHQVAFVSLWPGPTVSASSLSLLKDNLWNQAVKENLGLSGIDDETAIRRFKSCESDELTGKCIVALAEDRELMRKTGKTLLTCDLMREYGLKDEAGHQPMDPRQLSLCLHQAGYHRLAGMVPGLLRVPRWVFYLIGYRF